MNEIVSFTKEIDFGKMFDKITSISLEHTLSVENSSTIKGDLIVTGTYRQSAASQIDSPFSYKIPVDIVLDDKYDLSNVVIDIDDFTYETNDNKLIVNIDILIDKLSIKNKKDDDLIDINDLFLEKDNEKKLEIEKDSCLEKSNNDINENKKNDIKEIVDNNNDTNNKESDSLFSNFETNAETYSTYSVYIVRDNDNIEEILNKYKISKNQLEEYNDLSDIKTGTKLIIPSNNE